MADAAKHSPGSLLLNGLYLFLYGCVKYAPTPVGDWLRYLVLKLFAQRVQSSYIRDGVTVVYPHGLSLGAHCSLNDWVYIDAWGGVEIGDWTRVAARAAIISENHSLRLGEYIARQPCTQEKVTIGTDVWIGTGAIILPGVTIGDGAVIGAGAVVTSDVPSNAIAAGVPARVLRSRS